MRRLLSVGGGDAKGALRIFARPGTARPRASWRQVSARRDPTDDAARAEDGRPAAWLDALRRGTPIDEAAVVAVAHPDDETASFGLRLAKFAELTLVSVTDGSPEDMGDARRAGFSTRAAYARARAAELDAALKTLGAAPRRVALGVRDQTAVRRLPGLVDRLRRRLAGAALVVTHAYEGGHPDHDACAFAVQLACEALAAEGRAAPARFEFAGYHMGASGPVFGFWPDPAFPAVRAEASPAEVARKAEAMHRHRSQGRIMAWFDPAVEAYRRSPRYDFARPPPPGAAVYDSWGWAITSAHWRETARRALAALRGGA
jgi:LmbE family N-acetylglucosaminyl deacetylase